MVFRGAVFQLSDNRLTIRSVQDSVFDSLESKSEGRLLAGSTRWRAVLPRPDSFSPPRRAPPDPTGPYCVRVLDSTGLHRISLVRACEKSFRRLLFNDLEGTREASLIYKQSCSTPPRHPGVRLDSNRLWYVRALDSTGD